MSIKIEGIDLKVYTDTLLEQSPGIDVLHFLIDFSVILFDLNTQGIETLNILENVDQQYAIKEIVKNNLQLAGLNFTTVGEAFPRINDQCKDLIIKMVKMLSVDEHCYQSTTKLFQYMLEKMLINNGRYFFTPIHLADMMVRMIAPSEYECVLDPACGSGRLLAAVYKQKKSCELHGMDINNTITTFSFFNLYFSGKAKANLLNRSFLEESEEKSTHYYDVVLSNTPYDGDINITIDFVGKIMKTLKSNGRCAVLVPEGLLTNTNRNVFDLRRRILDENCLEAVVSLPWKIYKPYTESKSSLILLRKQPLNPLKEVFMCSLPEYDGPESEFSGDVYKLDMERIVESWKFYSSKIEFPENDDLTDFFWTVTYDDIIAKDYILAADAYRQSEYSYTKVEFKDLRNRIFDDQAKLVELFEQYKGVNL